MTLSEIKFEKDSFVESMVEKHPDLQAMREELSFWLNPTSTRVTKFDKFSGSLYR